MSMIEIHNTILHDQTNDDESVFPCEREVGYVLVWNMKTRKAECVTEDKVTNDMVVFVPVEKIDDVPASVMGGETTVLTGRVLPNTATFNKITNWRIDPQTQHTGLRIVENTLMDEWRLITPKLNTTITIIIHATIKNGLGSDGDYEETFNVIIMKAP